MKQVAATARNNLNLSRPGTSAGNAANLNSSLGLASPNQQAKGGLQQSKLGKDSNNSSLNNSNKFKP